MTHQGWLLFIDNPDVSEGDLIAHIGAADSQQALLNALGAAFDIPEPYGRNWDAFDEMLTSLYWTDARSVWIVHREVPHLPPADLKIYLSILRDANAFWKQRGDRSLVAVFPASAKADLEPLTEFGR